MISSFIINFFCPVSSKYGQYGLLLPAHLHQCAWLTEETSIFRAADGDVQTDGILWRRTPCPFFSDRARCSTPLRQNCANWFPCLIVQSLCMDVWMDCVVKISYKNTPISVASVVHWVFNKCNHPRKQNRLHLFVYDDRDLKISGHKHTNKEHTKVEKSLLDLW